MAVTIMFSSPGICAVAARAARSGVVQILQIDSQEKAGMSWHDSGRLFFMMRLMNIENLHFDRAWMDIHSS
jgi:uncharacterized protein YwqG